MTTLDFRMPAMMENELHPFLITLWTEALIQWVDENKHLMARGTKKLKNRFGSEVEVTGLLHDGKLFGWGTYKSKEGDPTKSTWFSDIEVGRVVCYYYERV